MLSTYTILGCVSLSLKSGNSPFWEVQGGGYLSLKWPHNLKYIFFASWWTGADLAPGHLLVKELFNFFLHFLLFLRYGNPHLYPSGNPLNLSETHPWARFLSLSRARSLSWASQVFTTPAIWNNSWGHKTPLRNCFVWFLFWFQIRARCLSLSRDRSLSWARKISRTPIFNAGISNSTNLG